MGSRYEVIRSLARGGMAEVFSARAHGADGYHKQVALKRISASFASDAQAVQMLKDEARLALRLTHPNVVQVFELGEDDHGYFLAMELVDGRDLGQILHERSQGAQLIPEMCAVAIAIDVLRGLDYAHRLSDERGRPLGVVHRDVSPSNVLLSTDGVVKLGDFGIAKARGRLQHTDADQVKGKMRYMSPEQVLGKPLDGRSDVFSLGLVLWECLAGRRAYQVLDEIELFRIVAKAAIPPLERIAPGTPPALAEAVGRALELDPLRRFATAGEMASTLDRFHRRAHPDFGPEYLAALVDRTVADLAIGPQPPAPATSPPTVSERVPHHAEAELSKTRPTVPLGPAVDVTDATPPAGTTRPADEVIAEAVEDETVPRDSSIAATKPAKPIF